MKTNELIRQLQEADPSGEIEVCVDNCDIHFVSKDPAYHDGRLQVLQRDPSKTGRGYDVIGVDIRSHGHKISLNVLSVENVLLDDPEAPVTFGSEDVRRDWEYRIEELRKEYRE